MTLEMILADHGASTPPTTAERALALTIYRQDRELALAKVSIEMIRSWHDRAAKDAQLLAQVADEMSMWLPKYRRLLRTSNALLGFLDRTERAWPSCTITHGHMAMLVLQLRDAADLLPEARP